MDILATITLGQIVCAALTVALIYDLYTRLRETIANRADRSERTDP